MDIIHARPMVARVGVNVLIVVVIFWLNYLFDTRYQFQNIEQQHMKEVQLRQLLESRQHQVANLATYKAQLQNIRESFKALLRELPTGPDISRNKEPLEKFSLDSLRMVGTLSRSKQVWAIISAPDGNVFAITLGNYLGRNFGKVVNVFANKIEISESILDSGNWRHRSASILMKQQLG